MEPENPLRAYFERNPGRLIKKWMHYFDVYHRHLERFRHRPVTLLEVGVGHGGSLQMWKEYLGRGARIVGVDIAPRAKTLEEEQVEIVIGDQEDRTFLRMLARELRAVDIVIDDGGHRMTQQIATFEELFPIVAPTGVYLVEDLHTSYWARYGGGYANPASFIEYSKRLVDRLNAWHSEEPDRLRADTFTRSASGLHYYDSVLVIEKAPRERPEVRKTGRRAFEGAES